MSVDTTPQGSLFGYSRRAVASRFEAYEALLEEKQRRMLDLRDENIALKEELERYRLREREISEALIDARARADEILEGARRQAGEELDRSHKLVRQLEAMASNRKSALAELARQAEEYARDFIEQLDGQAHNLELLEGPVPELEKLTGRRSA